MSVHAADTKSASSSSSTTTATTAASGNTLPPTSFKAEINRGYESYSSPLAQISDEGVLLRLSERSQLAGHFDRIALSGSHSIKFTDFKSLDFNLNVEDKRFDNVQDLNFSMASFDAMFRQPFAGGSLGLGPSLQITRIANRPFRQRLSLQGDLTFAQPDTSYTTWGFEHGHNKQADQELGLDSNVTQLLVRKRMNKPVSWLEEIAVEAGVGREKNLRNQASLSNQLYYIHVSTDWMTGPLRWSAGVTTQKARFDEKMTPDIDDRRDHLVALDLSISYFITKSTTLKLDLSRNENKSTVALFENRFQGFAFSLINSF